MDTFALHAPQMLVKRGVLFLYDVLIKPRLETEDDARREFILNILLGASVLLSTIFLCIVVYNRLQFGPSRVGVSLEMMGSVLGGFIGLWILSRRGYVRTAASLLVMFYFLPITYALYTWGADLPQGLLAYALLIVLSSILVGTTFSFLATLVIAIAILTVTSSQLQATVSPVVYWKLRPTTLQDGIAVSVTLAVIAIISWLSNREIVKSLERARSSEAALRHERDSLEEKVEERTRDLQRVQIEKMAQMHRFVEFGRLASGFFHDLASPLTAISLSLERVKADLSPEVAQAKSHIERAFQTTKTLEGFLDIVGKQIRQEEADVWFAPAAEIENALTILNYKAKKAGVVLNPHVTDHACRLYGNPFKFCKIVMNLISNAIDAYRDSTISPHDRFVRIEWGRFGTGMACMVEDGGCGISEPDMKKIFEPFFTTKAQDGGMGIGLSTVKEMVEKSFAGHIQVQSAVGVGTRFTLIFPSAGNPVSAE